MCCGGFTIYSTITKSHMGNVVCDQKPLYWGGFLIDYWQNANFICYNMPHKPKILFSQYYWLCNQLKTLYERFNKSNLCMTHGILLCSTLIPIIAQYLEVFTTILNNIIWKTVLAFYKPSH